MARQDKTNQGENVNVEQMRRDRDTAQASGDTARVAELDEQIREAEQGNQTSR